jgi:Tol biopolymer transport system component
MTQHPARLALILLAVVLALAVGSAQGAAPAAEPAVATPSSPGDLTCDHQVDGRDSLALASYLAGLSPLQTPGCPLIGAGTSRANGKIAFTSDAGDIIVMDADGSNQTNITNSAAYDELPSWSPDGKRLVFDSNRDGGHSQLYIMNPDGSGLVRLTNSNADDSAASWSPDGTMLAFDSFSNNVNSIFVVNADGSGRHDITNNAASDNWSPAWSPDGTRIAFSSSRGGNYGDLYLMNPDGTQATPLVQDSHYKANPTWSPDGTEIAFSEYDGTNTNVFVVPATGGQPIALTSAPKRNSDPSWSPDDAFILFDSVRDDPHPTTCDPCQSEIYRMDANGSNQTRLTDLPGVNSEPTWQPIPASLFGDLNCDGVIDFHDLMVSLKGIAGLALNLPPGCPAPS